MQPESSVWRIDFCYAELFQRAWRRNCEIVMTPETNASVTNCGNCNAPMPRELRFCRNCGFRLGEGLAEYTETVRFQNVPPGTLPGNGAAQFQQHQYGGMAVSSPGRPCKRKSA